jgi:hypothetical protein
MTISTKTFPNLQPGVSAADDLRVRTPINQALQWLGEGLPNEINADFSVVNSALAQISQSVSVQIAAALDGTAGEQTYVEGTFTPALAFGGASTGITYSTQTGTYTRIGRTVYVEISITLSSKGSATGNATITGLPLTAAATLPLGIETSAMTAGVGDTHVTCLTSATTTSLLLRDVAGGSASSMTDVDFTNTSVLRIAGVYRTSA